MSSLSYWSWLDFLLLLVVHCSTWPLVCPQGWRLFGHFARIVLIKDRKQEKHLAIMLTQGWLGRLENLTQQDRQNVPRIGGFGLKRKKWQSQFASLWEHEKKHNHEKRVSPHLLVVLLLQVCIGWGMLVVRWLNFWPWWRCERFHYSVQQTEQYALCSLKQSEISE